MIIVRKTKLVIVNIKFVSIADICYLMNPQFQFHFLLFICVYISRKSGWVNSAGKL